MFGSDWPVCNLAGHGEHETWRKWYEAVSVVLDRSQMTGEEKQFVWWRTANEAYGLGHDVDTNSD